MTRVTGVGAEECVTGVGAEDCALQAPQLWGSSGVEVGVTGVLARRVAQGFRVSSELA